MHRKDTNRVDRGAGGVAQLQRELEVTQRLWGSGKKARGAQGDAGGEGPGEDFEVVRGDPLSGNELLREGNPQGPGKGGADDLGTRRDPPAALRVALLHGPREAQGGGGGGDAEGVEAAVPHDGARHQGDLSRPGEVPQRHRDVVPLAGDGVHVDREPGKGRAVRMPGVDPGEGSFHHLDAAVAVNIADANSLFPGI